MCYYREEMGGREGSVEVCVGARGFMRGLAAVGMEKDSSKL